MLAAAVVLLGLALDAGARAAATAGTSGAAFLKLGAGARAAAMADAVTASPDDAFSMYHNPAGIVRLDKAQIGGAHAALFQGITYQTLALAYPFGREEGRERVETEGNAHAIGLAIYHLGVADIERRTGDTTGSLGTFGASDAAYAGTYARAFGDRLSLGVTGKFVSQTIDSYNANAFAADLGILYRLNPHADRPARLGAAVRNAGSKIGYNSATADPLPTTVVVGASGSPLSALHLSLEAGKPRDNDPYGAFGAEAVKSLGETARGALRFGYTSARRDIGGLAGLSAGAGFSFPKAVWVPFGNLGDSFRFSLLVKF
jgi:hypothetical protein